eukprot:3203157-Pleurochrysis_carterae.AAC.1
MHASYCQIIHETRARYARASPLLIDACFWKRASFLDCMIILKVGKQMNVISSAQSRPLSSLFAIGGSGTRASFENELRRENPPNGRAPARAFPNQQRQAR